MSKTTYQQGDNVVVFHLVTKKMVRASVVIPTSYLGETPRICVKDYQHGNVFWVDQDDAVLCEPALHQRICVGDRVSVTFQDKTRTGMVTNMRLFDNDGISEPTLSQSYAIVRFDDGDNRFPLYYREKDLTLIRRMGSKGNDSE